MIVCKVCGAAKLPEASCPRCGVISTLPPPNPPIPNPMPVTFTPDNNVEVLRGMLAQALERIEKLEKQVEVLERWRLMHTPMR